MQKQLTNDEIFESDESFQHYLDNLLTSDVDPELLALAQKAIDRQEERKKNPLTKEQEQKEIKKIVESWFKE